MAPLSSRQRRSQNTVPVLYTRNPGFALQRQKALRDAHGDLKTSDEELIKSILRDKRIVACYEADALPVGDKIHAFRPDFFLEGVRQGKNTMQQISMGGRQILLEVHHNCSPEYMRKVSLLLKSRGDEFHVIMASDMPALSVMGNGTTMNRAAYVSEYWHLPQLTSSGGDREPVEKELEARISDLLRKADFAMVEVNPTSWTEQMRRAS